MAIIGANTDPMKYKKSVMSVKGKKIAPRVPMTVTAIARILPLIRPETVSPEMPAE